MKGTHARLYQKLGCHLRESDAVFSVWAPNAESVSVIGDFNQWQHDANPARPRGDGTGIWEVAIAGVQHGNRYKFAVRSRSGELLEKADPVCALCRISAGYFVNRLEAGNRIRMERCRLDARPATEKRAGIAAIGL